MMAGLSLRVANWMMCVALAFAISACGKKGDPVPSSHPSSSYKTGIRVEKSEGAVEVIWLAGPAPEASFFRLERADIGNQGGACPDCPLTFVSIVEFSVGDQRYCKQGIPCVYRDLAVHKGSRYFYRLLWCDDRGRCDVVSETAEIVY